MYLIQIYKMSLKIFTEDDIHFDGLVFEAYVNDLLVPLNGASYEVLYSGKVIIYVVDDQIQCIEPINNDYSALYNTHEYIIPDDFKKLIDSKKKDGKFKNKNVN